MSGPRGKKEQSICNGKCAPSAMQGFARTRENPSAQEQWKAMERAMRRTMEAMKNPSPRCRTGFGTLNSSYMRRLPETAAILRLIARPSCFSRRLSAGSHARAFSFAISTAFPVFGAHRRPVNPLYFTGGPFTRARPSPPHPDSTTLRRSLEKQNAPGAAAPDAQISLCT